jgi:hypothetical protein
MDSIRVSEAFDSGSIPDGTTGYNLTHSQGFNWKLSLIFSDRFLNMPIENRIQHNTIECYKLYSAINIL